jgi:2-polyprenyl-6-hydroxyphenyl methylase/3-demethylubiquinone-9 3-methyltransferase
MPTIDNGIYDRVHATWWEQDGFMALLRTSVNPPRVEYFHDVLVRRLRLDPGKLRVLDVGCGGGLLSEPLARLGCTLTGIDRSLPTLDAARAHARANGLDIDYLHGSAESLPFEPGKFDVVVCCDVLEHVDDVEAVVSEIARVLKPGGVFLFDTINRTLRSKLVAIKLAQDWRLTRLIPRDVHVWDKFVRPGELVAAMERHGLSNCELAGLSPEFHPSALGALLRNKLGRLSYEGLGERLKLRRSNDLSVSYMGFALRSLQ